MFLQEKDFLKEEKQAPILNLNNAYLNRFESTPETLFDRAHQWIKLLDTEGVKTFQVQDIEPTQSNRIIKEDADRVFLEQHRRKHLVKLLSCYEAQFGDYHQGLALTSGFLLINLQPSEVATIITVLSSNPKYLFEYWRAEAIAAARDAYVFLHIVGDKFPDVYKHLKDKNVMPETFCQKWFVALCVNVLPFPALYRFFELFLEHGYMFLLKFGLSLVDRCREEILTAKDYEIYRILRLETNKLSDDDKLEIVNKAVGFDLSGYDIEALRKKEFDENLKVRLENAKKAMAEKGDSDEEDDEESGGAECEICTEMMPDFYCEDCKKLVCEKCHKKSKGGHDNSHNVQSDWEKFV